MNPPKIVLVDGSSFIFRAYFAIPDNLATTSGLHTNAIYGFALMFRKLFAGRKPELGAVVFDSAVKTFRAEMYPAYKAQRPPLSQELVEQLPWIDRLVKAHRFHRLRVDGYEADDVIGTLTAQAAAKGMEVLIVSGDKDFAQLIGERVRMVDTLRDITYDEALVFKKWGVRPQQMVDLLALMGDSSDNIPGVTGIGQKGAASLLAQYGSLEGIYASLGELKGRQKTALDEGRENAFLSRALATINTEVPLPVTLDGLALEPPDPGELNALYRELQFFSLLSIEARDQGEAAEVTLCRNEEEVRSALELVFAEQPVAVVALYDEASPLFGSAVGLALTSRAGRTCYIPASADNLPLLRVRLEDAAALKVTHDLKSLWLFLQRLEIDLAGVVGDTQLASYLVDPTKLIPHRLDQLAREYLQRALVPATSITGRGQKASPLSELPVETVARYAGQLSSTVAAVWPKLVTQLESLGLVDHLRKHEMPLALVLGQMERSGIRVDRAALARIGKAFALQLKKREEKIFELSGREFNVGSSKQLSKVLFEDLKLPIIKKTKTGYSTDTEVLERLAAKHEVARVVVEYRQLAKLINTYTDVLQRSVNPQTGRVHTTFQQTVSASGRLITTDPDLQRTPVKTAEGKRIRSAFIPAPGCLLISADWSQIELRILAHVSNDPLLIEAFASDQDVHRRTASQLFGCEPDAVTREQRNVGKTVNFATIYGQGATALGNILDIPRKQAEQYIAQYFETYAGVRAWLDRTIKEAHRRGYVMTLLGRRRYIPELSSKNFMDRQTGERMAVNTPIQGSAADLCKLAMIVIAERLQAEELRARMLLQIHDELVFEAPQAEVGRVSAIVKEVMENTYPLIVPLVVEVGTGKSWAAAH